jgi:precorrin-3B synthase
MQTGDGLLARLMPAAPIPPGAMAGLCAAARAHGNRTVEITARGSLQVRGLTLRSAPLFAAAVADLGIAVQEGVPVIAGFDDDAVDGLASELRRAIAVARLALSPKVSVVVDGDGPLHLDALLADVRVRVVRSEQGPRCHVGALTTWLGAVAPEEAVRAVIDILRGIAAHGPAARAVDISSPAGVAALQRIVRGIPTSAPPRRPPADMIGIHTMSDGAAAVGVAPAFGHTDADTLEALVRVAASQGAKGLRPAPGRALLLAGVSVRGARDVVTVAEQLGFVVRSDDPRRCIAACPGAPACASGLIPARTLASALAPALAPLLARAGNSVAVHISGCSKGCAHPGPAALTLVGAPQGCGVVRHDSARAAPHRYIDPARLGEEISRLAAERDPMEEAAHG